MKNNAPKALWALLIVLVSYVPELKAQLYTYTDNLAGTASYVNPNLWGSELKRRNMAHAAGGLCPVGFTSKNFSTETTFNTGQPNVSVRLTPQPAVYMTLSSVSADFRITEKGPIYVRAAYSKDRGATWIDAGFDFTPLIALCGEEGSTGYWDIPDFTTDKAVLIRFFGYGATGFAGTLEVRNLVIDGTLTLVDFDHDGYGAFIDCDNYDSSIHPDAVDVCNSIDEDCDGNLDEVDAPISPSGEITLCKHETVTLSVDDVFETYQWYKNGTSIGAAGTSHTLTTDKAGYYEVYLTSGDCDGFTSVQAVAVVDEPFANIYWPEGLDLCTDDSLKLKASYDVGYSWQWYKDGLEIPYENFYKMLALEPGDYYCVVTNAFGCERTTESVTVYNSCRTTSAVNGTSLEIFPNPAHDKFTLSMELGNEETSSASVQILTVTGEVVYTENTEINNGSLYTTLNVAGLSNGVYLVQVKAAENIYSSRLVINK